MICHEIRLGDGSVTLLAFQHQHLGVIRFFFLYCHRFIYRAALILEHRFGTRVFRTLPRRRFPFSSHIHLWLKRFGSGNVPNFGTNLQGPISSNSRCHFHLGSCQFQRARCPFPSCKVPLAAVKMTFPPWKMPFPLGTMPILHSGRCHWRR